eukprot:403368266
MVFPSLACCLRRCAKKNNYKSLMAQDEEEDLKRLDKVADQLGVSIDKDGDLKADLDLLQNQAVTEDPYLNLGFGLVAYFKMIKTFIFLFFVFSLLSIPAIGIYSSHKGLEGLQNYSRAKFSLGNMGFSDSICMSMYLGVDGPQQIQCREGKISSLFSQGIIPKVNNGQEAYCGLSSKGTLEISQCSDKYVDTTKLQTYFDENCKDQESCKTPINFRDYVKFGDKNDCTDDNAIFYLQYFCLENNDGVTAKRQEALVVACLGIFISLIFLCAIYYLFETSKLEYKTWDVSTVTAADFTVESLISEKMWNNFLQQYQDKIDPTETLINKFHTLYKAEVEKVAQDEKGVLNNAEDQEIRVTNITFAFNNVDLLKLLSQRGMLVTKALHEKVKVLDQKINQLKDQKRDQLTRPVAAFITFETQEGYERACNIKGKKNWKKEIVNSKHKFFDDYLCFQEAPEPTNIIWENRDRTFKQQTTRKIIVVAIIIILLIAAFIAFYVLKLQTIRNYQKYPPATDCNSISEIFGGNYDNANFIKYAEQDNSLTQNKKGTGIYFCFCKDYRSKQNTDKKYEFCDDYKNDQYLGLGLSKFVSVAITLVIKSSIFITQFFNTAILLLLTNANTQQTFLSFLPFEGQYPDLTYEWYNDIGSSLVITLLTAAFFPIAEFFIAWGMKTAFRILDRGFSCNRNLTKCKTVQQYVNLYSGPDYMMHAKYSAMLNVTFVTFMYGLAIPLLFPIAFCYFIVLYCVEKLCLTYFFKKPPMFDEKLNESVIATLKWAPVFMMIFGFWMMGNRQIFQNTVLASEYKTDPTPTDHKGYDISVDQSLPLFILGIVMFFFIFFNDLFLSILQKLRLAKVDEEAEVDEQLGTYIQCLGRKNRQIWRIDETHLRNEFGIKTLTEDTIAQLKINKPHNKIIRTCPNYEIVSNSKYSQLFQFTPVDMRDTAEEKYTSDMVAKMLYLAYFSEHQQKNIVFKEGGIKSKKYELKDSSIKEEDDFKRAPLLSNDIEEEGKSDNAI